MKHFILLVNIEIDPRMPGVIFLRGIMTPPPPLHKHEIHVLTCYYEILTCFHEINHFFLFLKLSLISFQKTQFVHIKLQMALNIQSKSSFFFVLTVHAGNRKTVFFATEISLVLIIGKFVIHHVYKHSIDCIECTVNYAISLNWG